MSNTPPKPVEREYHRLTDDSYRQLEKQLPPPMVDSASTTIQAAHALGVQLVLKLLREGFVVR